MTGIPTLSRRSTGVSALAILSIVFTAAPTRGQTLIVLTQFYGPNGSNPYGELTRDASGNIYGTTSSGGANNDGTVFEINGKTGVFSTIVTFNGANGAAPTAPLILDSSGNLYGTTSMGPNMDIRGSVFELAAGTHAMTTLVSFPQGFINAPVTLDSSGNIFGVTQAEGPDEVGTAFELAAGTRSLTTLASFDGAVTGARPQNAVTIDASGNLFGTTYFGGADRHGTLYEIAAGSNTVTPLVTFNGTNGAEPQSNLLLLASGSFIGTTAHGGANGDGTVFEYNPSTQSLTTIASFNGANGNAPVLNLAMDAAGDIFGTTDGGGANNDGTVFEIRAGTNTITTLVSFNGSNGAFPAGIALDSSGNLYGTTFGDGSDNLGTAYEITGLASVPEPSPAYLIAALGAFATLRAAWRRRLARA